MKKIDEKRVRVLRENNSTELGKVNDTLKGMTLSSPGYHDLRDSQQRYLAREQVYFRITNMMEDES